MAKAVLGSARPPRREKVFPRPGCGCSWSLQMAFGCQRDPRARVAAKQGARHQDRIEARGIREAHTRGVQAGTGCKAWQRCCDVPAIAKAPADTTYSPPVGVCKNDFQRALSRSVFEGLVRLHDVVEREAGRGRSSHARLPGPRYTSPCIWRGASSGVLTRTSVPFGTRGTSTGRFPPLWTGAVRAGSYKRTQPALKDWLRLTLSTRRSRLSVGR